MNQSYPSNCPQQQPFYPPNKPQCLSPTIGMDNSCSVGSGGSHAPTNFVDQNNRNNTSYYNTSMLNNQINLEPSGTRINPHLNSPIPLVNSHPTGSIQTGYLKKPYPDLSVLPPAGQSNTNQSLFCHNVGAPATVSEWNNLNTPINLFNQRNLLPIDGIDAPTRPNIFHSVCFI